MAEFEPRDPQWAARVQDAFRRDGLRRRTLLQPLNAALDAVAPGRVVLALDWPVGDGGAADDGGGMVDSGLAAAVLSMAGELAALSLAAPGVRLVPVEHKVNFTAGPAAGGLYAVGEVTQSGRTITVGRGRLYAAGPDSAAAPPLAQMLATYISESDG